jgi:hypothetical protein
MIHETYGTPPVQETLRQMGARILKTDHTEQRKAAAVFFLERHGEGPAHIAPESN